MFCMRSHHRVPRSERAAFDTIDDMADTSDSRVPKRPAVRRRGGSGTGGRGSGLELTWPGKGDPAAILSTGDGPVARTAFRCIERLGCDAAADRASWRDRLFHGDNLDVLRFIGAELAGAVDLIYIDPPFDIGLDFGVRVPMGDGTPIETTAYSDRWTAGAGSHAHMMWERLHLMRGLLKPSGCLFLHCDWRSSAVMRLILDEIFGPACFRNEIVWRRAPNLGRQAASNQLGRVAESILVYSARPGTRFAGVAPTRSQVVPEDANGRPRGTQWDDERKGYFTTAPRGDYTDESVARLRAQGRIHDTASGNVYVKYFLRKGDDGRWYKDHPVDTIWDDPDVRPLRHCSREELAVGYATQKPEGLLRRIISWGSPPGGLVADLFCGSGTTGVVAAKLGRRWIMADASPLAIRIARSRLLAEAEKVEGATDIVRTFDVFHPDPGRVHAATEPGGNDATPHRRRVLEAFGACVRDSLDPLLHGVLADDAVHVSVAPGRLEASTVETAARAAARAGFQGLHCLADRFDPALHRIGPAGLAIGGVSVRLVPIPWHVLHARCADRSPWSELPHIDVVARADAGRIRVDLRQCSWRGLHANDAPDPLAAVEWWGIDRLGIDGGPFTPAWQSRRTWRCPRVESSAGVPDAEASEPATTVRVGVMDVLGRLWHLEVAVERA